MISIMGSVESRRRNIAEKTAAVVFALLVWQAAALLMDNSLLLVSPFEVAGRLISLCMEAEFWYSVSFTLLRITSGFVLGCASGVVLAVCSNGSRMVRLLLWPFIAVIKAVPVASFIILCLIWISSDNLSIIISFIMVMPVIYTNVLQGLDNTDPKLLEMCSVFHIRGIRKLLYVLLPQIKPYLISACTIACGMAWKSGTAAEVIGIPDGSIGERLYEAKVYLSTGDLFAWTIVIVLISAGVEKLFIKLLNLAYIRLEKG